MQVNSTACAAFVRRMNQVIVTYNLTARHSRALAQNQSTREIRKLTTELCGRYTTERIKTGNGIKVVRAIKFGDGTQFTLRRDLEPLITAALQ